MATKRRREASPPEAKKNEPNVRDVASGENRHIYAVFDQAPAMIAISRGPDLVYEYANPVYLEVVGRDESIIGQPLLKALPELKGQPILGILRNVYDTGTPYRGDEMLVPLRTHGDEPQDHYFNFVYQPYRDETGVIDGIMTHAVDVTQQVISRKRAEESEDRFRNLADTAPMYIAMADETGSAVYFNRKWLEFTGKSMAQLKGFGWLSTLHPDDAAKFEKDFKHAFSKRMTIDKEYRFRRADGEFRWMRAVGAPRFGPSGEFMGYYGTYTDFHDLKMALEAVQESEARFRTMFEQSADAVQLASPEGKILFSSVSVERVLGYTPEEIQGADLAPYLHPDDAPGFFKQWTALLKTPRKIITVEYRVKHKDGSWVLLETTLTNHLNTPGISAILGNFRDITERKQTELSLRTQQLLLEAITENATLGLFMMDDQQRCTFLNPAAERIVGYSMSEILELDKPLHDIIHYKHPDGTPYPMEECPIDRALPQKMRAQGEDVFVRPDGSFYSVAFTASPIIRDGKPTGTVIEVRDTTQEKADQEEHQRLMLIEGQQKELLKLNRAKDEFIALASHQLRTPATAVKQYIAIALDEYVGPLNDEQSHVLRTAYESNERQLTIINDLLKTAQIDSTGYNLEKQPVDLVALVRHVSEEMTSALRLKQQTVTIDCPHRTITVLVDMAEMNLVFTNLLENASKYSFNDSEITIRLRRNAHRVRVTFIDQGVGMKAEDVERIFDKFTRVNNELSDTVSGTGLGLYWVKQIVELHGGAVHVKSRPREGSTFCVELPT